MVSGERAAHLVNGAAHVLKNESVPGTHWLTLRLRGTTSNRDGFAATARLVAAGGAEQWASVSTAGSYLSAGDRRVHFGLGEVASVASVEIRWPSGIVQRIEHPVVDHLLDVVEPAAATSR